NEGCNCEQYFNALTADRRAAVLVTSVHNTSVQSTGFSRVVASNEEQPAKAGALNARALNTRLWVAAERLPQLNVIFPNAATEPQIGAPEALASTYWDFESALVEIIRGRLEGLGPVTAQGLADSLGIAVEAIEAALVKLEAEGFVFRGRFTPGLGETEWCARRLLARIHSYTLNRLRQEIEPVSSSDFIRFLLAWQKVAPDHQVEGPDALAALIDQLEGFEAPAAAWEGEILPARMNDYDPAWLDSLCLSGQVVWARLTAPKNGDRTKASGPVRTTPISLINRRDAALWNSLFPGTAREQVTLSHSAEAVFDFLSASGASFFTDLVDGVGLLRSQVEDALGELVACGLVAADSYAGMRALLTPANRKTSAAKRRGKVAYDMTSAGRWSLLGRRAAAPIDQPSIEKLARILLRRYGVVFKRVLEREGFQLPWRSLLKIYHRLEQRGEIRGGRFVSGLSGEQFALPDAVGMLRAMRRAPSENSMVSVSAADPLNLVGIITPDERVQAFAANRVLYRDGIPIAKLESGVVSFLVDLEPALRWQAKNALVRRSVAPALRTYLSRPA
ncbi:MAG TPA: ATP-dependent DNA helicase, partial [Blastocatellia bacterium]|nr:ATP-dependent DNA helicase [Blastocatellia bacterium]